MTEDVDSRLAGPLSTDHAYRAAKPAWQRRGGRHRERRAFTASATSWEPRYRQAVIATDLIATSLVVIVVGAVMKLRHPAWTAFELVTLEVLTVLAVAWALGLSRVWHPVVLGQGPDEFSRLGKGLFASIVALNLSLLAVGTPAGARLWVFVVVPAIAMLVFPQRYVLRQLLHRQRYKGRCLLPVLAAGNPAAIRDLIARTRDSAHVGWRVDAVCTETGMASGPNGSTNGSANGSANGHAPNTATDLDGVPIIGTFRDVAQHVWRGGYRIVAITPDAYWTPDRLRTLAWDLEGTGTEMVIDPGLMAVAGPRLHVSGVLGMPVLRVSEPTFTGFRRVIKELVDRSCAALLLMLLAPLLLTVSVLIAVESKGPVFYRQRRVGKDGTEFTIVKFRTMHSDADQRLAELAASNDGAGPLFKLRADPRITRVGAVLRRYSLDELPQLFNVLGGSMSLVGPRPPLPSECAEYPPHVRRRLLVKPGMTGLWQVSGRSDLSWEASVQLDLRYVEDWSLALDALILWKTIRAVASGEGAY
ncbi:MAG: exopolysaccharide biosynthesis polyprenyl glycosylphosphotransferase [Actinophytocola sp.]|nr:exopolysaccharide biosynthesis polyprenyl glycosylphosphotransferase [Actinophytocola sp.]